MILRWQRQIDSTLAEKELTSDARQLSQPVCGGIERCLLAIQGYTLYNEREAITFPLKTVRHELLDR